MKLFISVLLFALSASVFAHTPEQCRDRALIEYEVSGQPSDVYYTLSDGMVVAAGTPILGAQQQELARYTTDMIVYTVSGSYHSGWFQDLMVVDPWNCSLVRFFNLYAE